MKKTSIALFALFLACILMAGVLPLGIPSEELVPGVVEREDGTVLVAENRMLTSRVYTLDPDGTIRSVYRESRLNGEKESRIVHLAEENGNTYYVRVMNNNEDWELVQLGAGESVIATGALDDGVTITGLTARKGLFWITGLGAEADLVVYECTEAGAANIKLVEPAGWLSGVVSAEYDGTRVRATTVHGDHVFVSMDGEKVYSEEAKEPSIPELEMDHAGWLLCKKVVFMAAAALWLIIGIALTIFSMICHMADRLATRVTAVGSGAVLLALLASLGFLFYTMVEVSGLLKAKEAIVPAAMTACIIWLGSLVILRSATGVMTRLIPTLTRQMDGIADGYITPREVVPGKDELHRMDRSMQEMCMGLSIRDYEMKSTVRSYRRFVPQEITELLDRAVISEVSLGDSRRMEGNVGLFTVGNRAVARNNLEDTAFVDFINSSFSIFDKCVEDNHGYLLSGGLRLSSMDALFPKSAADGIRAGLDFLGQTRARPVSGTPTPRPFLMLHRASFLYGIAGREERLFPYLSSAELEFLGSYSQRFYEAGVRIVATETYWKQIKGAGFTGRYIGFVSDPEKGFAYKLYEVLDAYPELERELRRGYDQRLQEAINLFYRNDFYLARNLFSTLLRACPGDGIVRWYLFACERFFNQEGDEDPDYRLFGMEE